MKIDRKRNIKKRKIYLFHRCECSKLSFFENEAEYKVENENEYKVENEAEYKVENEAEYKVQNQFYLF